MNQIDQIRFSGGGWRLFWLAFGRMCLTIVTLGVARFWMMTRLRRYYWSSINIGGDSLEYTGRAGEKFVGFMIAVVILALYLAAVNLAMAFVGLAFFQGNPAALNLSVLAAIPLGFWAEYRARRYILARTRWRGIRFGLEAGAWGYMVRSLWWWSVTILSLGLLYPWKQLALTRYITDRSWFGDARFHQGGSLWPLLRAWLWLWLPLALLAAGGFGSAGGLSGLREAAETSDGATVQLNWQESGIAALALLVPVLLFGAAYLRYRVIEFRYLNTAKTLGETGFSFELRTGTTLRIYFLGYVLMLMAMAIAAAAVLALHIVALKLTIEGGLGLGDIKRVLVDDAPEGSATLVLVTTAGLYLFLVVLYTALRHAFITRPVLRAIVASTTILDIAALDQVCQRAHDEQAEAGGFADALGADVGGAF